MINDEEYIRIGVISSTHALKGRLKVYLITDNINRFNPGNTIYIKLGNQYSDYKISEFKPYKKKNCLLQLDGIDDIDKAIPLIGNEIFITKTEAENKRNELGDESFYYFDIIGCSAFIDEKLLGIVTEIIEAGSGEIIIIKDTNGKKFMIPFIKSMVDTKNIFEKRILINPVEGLIDI